METALAEFDSRKKLGGEEFSQKYRDQLEEEISELFNNYKAHNDSKNIFKAANTPITLAIMWSLLYIFSQVRSQVLVIHMFHLMPHFSGYFIIYVISSCQSCQLAHVGSCHSWRDVVLH